MEPGRGLRRYLRLRAVPPRSGSQEQAGGRRARDSTGGRTTHFLPSGGAIIPTNDAVEIGRVIVNSLPLSTPSLAADTLPPCSSTNWRTRASPMPNPAFERGSAAFACLARWLLMTRDRVESDQFLLTHEFLAHMLGTRREGVSAAASAFKRRKLIEYHRGKIQILDPNGLRAASCSCYETVQAAFRRAQYPVVPSG